MKKKTPQLTFSRTTGKSGKSLLPLILLEEKVFTTDRLTARSFKYHSEQESSLLIVASVDKKVAGYFLLFFRKNSKRARLYSLALDPDFHGLGLGSKLLLRSMEDARKRGCKTYGLEVRPDNESAVRLYIKHGFSIVRTREDFYQDGTSALVLEKEL